MTGSSCTCEGPNSVEGSLWLFGMLSWCISLMLTNIAILIQKFSAQFEAGRPVHRRWRFWCGFFLNLFSELVFSSIALAIAPLAALAPLGGLGVVFNAMLARFGLVCGIRESLSRSGWAATIVVLLGVTLVAVSGPGSSDLPGCDYFNETEPERYKEEFGGLNPCDEDSEIMLSALDLSLLGPAFATPEFLSATILIFSYVTAVLLLLHVPQLAPYQPAPGSTSRAVIAGTSAAFCGSYSVISLKLISTALLEWGSTGVMPDCTGCWVAVGLVVWVAPLQLYLLNFSLASGEATFTIPLYLAGIMVTTSLCGGLLLFQEFDALMRPPVPLYMVLYLAGIILVLAGLSFLSYTQEEQKQVKSKRVAPDVITEADTGSSLTDTAKSQAKSSSPIVSAAQATADPAGEASHAFVDTACAAAEPPEPPPKLSAVPEAPATATLAADPSHQLTVVVACPAAAEQKASFSLFSKRTSPPRRLSPLQGKSHSFAVANPIRPPLPSPPASPLAAAQKGLSSASPLACSTFPIHGHSSRVDAPS